MEHTLVLETAELDEIFNTISYHVEEWEGLAALHPDRPATVEQAQLLRRIINKLEAAYGSL